jgi:DNA polymerase-3 subunit alpha
MSSPSFVHLRTHTQYSIVDGLIDPEDLVSMAAEDGQPAVAMTDLHRMFGAMSFYKAARARGVKPIIGLDAWVDPDVTQHLDAGPVRMLLLCENEVGYKRLLDWISRSYLDNQRNGLARIKQSWFAEGTEGLLALSGDHVNGELGRAWSQGNPELVDKAVDFYRTSFPDRFFLEVQRAAHPGEDTWVPAVVELSQRHQVPLVATHPVQFAKREDFFAHEVRTCIGSKELVEDRERTSAYTREQYFKTQAEMQDLFSDLPVALENSVAIAKRCSAPIEVGKSYLPDFPTPDGSPLNEYFRKEARQGLLARLEEQFPDPVVRETHRAEYQDRLEYELNVIEKMGFPGYFMVVSDFIRWAKEQGIPVGPGRGSGAGSLVAYSLLITDIDPLPYHLLFERFLNPDRVSMPDFDIDFDAHRRGEVIEYVYKKYGEQCVAQIATYGTMKAKAALRDAGRALNLPYMLVDGVAKLIPGGPKNLNITIDEALEKDQRFQDRYNSDRGARRLIDAAKKIEGMPKSVGKHAGGVIIAPGKLTDFTPLYMADDASGSVVSQYDKDMVEVAGLVKFDFLGLSNLTIIDEAIKFINRRPEFAEKPFDLRKIPLVDPKVFALLGEGETVGVFQFESSGMQKLLKRAKPDCFEDIIALAALFRPGPLGSGMDRDWVDRKHGRAEVSYPHPLLENVLSPTYGVIVYQEQVMQIAQVLAGYTLGGADLLRRAMGKKKPEEMAKERVKFEKGCADRGIEADVARPIFDLMEKFAEYGFNKSHSAAYALIAYQTTYLKAHYSAEYYAAFMNVMAFGGKQEKIEVLIKDARAHGVKMLPPDVNEGMDTFQPVSGGIRYGLSGLKGVSEGTIQAMVRARETKGRFTSLIDFCEKVGRSVANKTVCEALVRSGAFDAIHPNRAALLDMVPAALDYTAKIGKQKAKALDASLLPDLFGGAEGTKKKKPRAVKEIAVPVPNDTLQWTLIEQLENERKAVGFYLSGHPFDGYAAELRALPAVLRLSEVDREEPSETKMHLVAGVISRIHQHVPANGKKMAFITIDDGESEKDVLVFNDLYEGEKGQQLFHIGKFVAFEVGITEDKRAPRNFTPAAEMSGHEEGEDDTGAIAPPVIEEPKNSMKAERAFSLEDLQVRSARGLHVALLPEELPALAELSQRFPVIDDEQPLLRATVYIPHNRDPERVITTDLPQWRMACSEQSLEAARQVFGERVKVEYARDWKIEPKPLRNNRRPRAGQR